jgi:2-dehydro-3-deoxyphosphooctonate aldolase (KDO 8-P synthase)
VKLCGFDAGLQHPLFLIAGPCVIESRELAIEVAGRLKETCAGLGMPFIFKSSYDKANRSSGKSYRGLGMEKGLEILADVKKTVGVPVLTDVIQAVAASGKPANIKKGQFLAPHDMQHVVAKAKEAIREKAGGAEANTDTILVCERGASFGYNNLVSDMRSLAILRETGCPVVYDATHSVQLPGGQGASSGGQREFVPVLARAAVAVGIAGLFMETHPNPEKALSDGPNSWPLAKMQDLLATLRDIDALVKQRGFMEAGA